VKKIGIKVSEARIGIETNNYRLLDKENFFWLDTNFNSSNQVPREEATDSFIVIIDSDMEASIEISGDTLHLTGPFSQWAEQTKDLRYSIFGNLGVFSSWVLSTLERKHRIYTFHACALVKGEKLLVILGGAGAGKTVFVLSSLRLGWRLFSTEFVHFRVNEGIEFFKGPVRDPVRIDTLKSSFPWVIDELDVDIKASVGGKTLVNLSAYQTESDVITNPDVVLVIPHVEEMRKRIIEREREDQEYLLKTLFLNASDKIGKSMLLYGQFAVPGFDSSALAQEREKNIRRLLTRGVINKSIIWVSGVADVEGFFKRWE
jgi:hypothetical protein